MPVVPQCLFFITKIDDKLWCFGLFCLSLHWELNEIKILSNENLYEKSLCYRFNRDVRLVAIECSDEKEGV